MSFQESLPSHIRFVEFCFLDWEVFHKTRSKPLKAFVRQLNPQAGLPHRTTCLKILGVIRTLIKQKLDAVISRHVAIRGAPCVGSQSDIWSEKSCRESFFCLRVSMMLDPSVCFSTAFEREAHAGTLIDAAPMLDFCCFEDTTHSGPVIAMLKRATLAKYGLSVETHLGLSTEDGASNNKKAAKILGRPFKVCFPHDQARAVLFAVGMAGAVSQNPQLKEAIGGMSSMAAAPHRSVKTNKALQDAQIAKGTSKSKVLTTSSMNATRWTGLYRMANKNRRLENELKLALTGTANGLTTEEPAQVEGTEVVDSSEDEGVRSEDDDTAQVQANIAAGKEYPLAHRVLDVHGFRNNSLLESILSTPHEVCLLVQKHEGMGLSLGYQMATVLYEVNTTPKLQVVSGTSKDGEWREIHAQTLPPMFQKMRTILAAEIDKRFKVRGTPDELTLLALAMDPSVDTSREKGMFQDRSAAQELMVGALRRGLLRRHQLATVAAKPCAKALPATSASVGPPQVLTPQLSARAQGKRPASATVYGSSKKGPASVLSLISSRVPVSTPPPSEPDSLEAVKVEEAKFEAISNTILEDSSLYRDSKTQSFNQTEFWANQKASLPLHYALWTAEVGCAKVASSNVEDVFSGAGRLSAKSRTLNPETLSDYAFCHYSYGYSWLRPSLDEIFSAYNKIYGKDEHPSDGESDSEGSGSEDENEQKSDGENNGEGEERAGAEGEMESEQE